MKRKIITVSICLCIICIAILITSLLLYSPVQVVIDPGHGGKDVGAKYSGRYEKDDNLALALLVNDNLKRMGIETYLTRKDDVVLELSDRCKIANRKKALLFVSLHRNSAEGAEGVEIWISSDAGETDKALAENILTMLDNAGISQNRGVKSGYARGEGDYYVNSHSEMPSCLVELGFINSEKDNELFDKNLEEYASAIASAISKTLMEKDFES